MNHSTPHDQHTRRIFKLAATGILLLASGCFAPSYKRPAMDIPPAFKEQVGDWKAATPSDAMSKGKWWEIFDDPRLNALEEKVATSNQSVKQAEAEYLEARSLVSYNQANYFPDITTNPAATRELSTSGNGTYSYTTLYSFPVTASWEPDFWGVLAMAVKGAKASAQAGEAQLENIRLSMEGQLASDYFTLEDDDMQEVLLSSAIASYDMAYQLTVIRHKGGVASQADVAQAQTQLETTKAQATDLALSRAQTEHAIAVLIGQSPSTFSLSTGTIVTPFPDIPGALPGDLLERRPDIAAAERDVAAANENVGLARAAYFPLVTLSATGGYAGSVFSSWFNWPSRIWALGAAATGTVFDFGRHSAQKDQAWAAFDAAAANYRQTVLGAFQEVEDNLAAINILAREADQQDVAVKAAEESLNLEMAQYKAGTVYYIDVVTTQNIALTNERTAVQILGRRMTSAVNLVLAIGGGWDISKLPYPKNMPPDAPQQALKTSR